MMPILSPVVGAILTVQGYPSQVVLSPTWFQTRAANAAQLAKDGLSRQSVYLTGRVGGESISLHGEGHRVVLTTEALLQLFVQSGGIPRAIGNLAL